MTVRENVMQGIPLERLLISLLLFALYKTGFLSLTVVCCYSQFFEQDFFP